MLESFLFISPNTFKSKRSGWEMRAGNIRAKENIVPCKKEATFRDFLLLKGQQLMQLRDCVALWPCVVKWNGLESLKNHFQWY